MGTLLRSCAEVRAAIELSFELVSEVTPGMRVLNAGPRASRGRGEFWGRLPHCLSGFNGVSGNRNVFYSYVKI